MAYEIEINDNFQNAYIEIIVKYAKELGQPVRILDLGSDELNPLLVKQLQCEGIDFRVAKLAPDKMLQGLERVLSDNSFDMVIGNRPNSRISDYQKLAGESARVLRPGGYHIINEIQVEWANPTAKRENVAMEQTQRRILNEVEGELDKVLSHIYPIYSAIYFFRTEERNPEQTLQNGDVVKDVIMVHRKGAP